MTEVQVQNDRKSSNGMTVEQFVVVGLDPAI